MSDDDIYSVVSDQRSDLTIDDRREWIDLSKFGNIFSHGGSSFYLRVGALDGGDDFGSCSELVDFVSRYLFPLVLEYSIIAIGTFVTIMHSGIGSSRGQGDLATGFQNLIKVSSLNILFSQSDTHNSEGHHHENKVLDKSHFGLFLGVIMIAISIIAIVMYHIYDRDISSVIIYQSADIFLHLSFLGGCVSAFIKTRSFAHIAKPLSVDDVLLLLAMIGAVMFEMSVIIPTINALHIHSEMPIIDRLQLTNSILSLVQALAQTLLILFALRSYPSEERHITEMPGRGSFAFLLLGNIGTWILRTFLGKGIRMTTPISFYGTVAWLLLLNINYPLLLFFRFHSSVCFADIWHQAYTPIHRKLDPQLRQQQKQLIENCVSQQRRSSLNGKTLLQLNTSLIDALDPAKPCLRSPSVQWTSDCITERTERARQLAVSVPFDVEESQSTIDHIEMDDGKVETINAVAEINIASRDSNDINAETINEYDNNGYTAEIEPPVFINIIPPSRNISVVSLPLTNGFLGDSKV